VIEKATKADKSKSHVEKHYKLHRRLLDLLGKAIYIIFNVKMISRGFYDIHVGGLRIMTCMPKIIEKVTLGEKSKNRNLSHLLRNFQEGLHNYQP